MSQKHWVRLYGNWGDIICQLNIAQSIIKNFPINVIFSTFVPSDKEQMKDFLACQNFIDTIIEPNDISCDIGAGAWIFTDNQTYKRELDKKFTSEDNIVINCCGFDQERAKLASNCFPLNIPDQYIDDYKINKPYILLQPYSGMKNNASSESLENHWIHWIDLINCIIPKYPKLNFVLCGIDWDFQYSYDNLKNMLGKTNSVLEIFDLANKSSYVITTANCLSHWVRSNNISSTIIENKTARYSGLKDYWQEIYWNNISPNRKIFSIETSCQNICDHLDLIFRNILEK